MKRVVLVIAVAVLVGTIIGCDFSVPATPKEQVQAFLTAASAVPQVPAEMKAIFDPETAQYVNMDLPTYWEATFFNEGQGAYAILNIADGPEDPDFPGSVTVTGNVTNSINTDPGYPAVFVLITDTGSALDSILATPSPLILKITVTVMDLPEVIEKVIP
ncbi:MAG: hypothetical protein V3S41_10240 [Spirochaetia bacterium]